MMSTCNTEEKLLDLIVGELPEEEVAAVEAHVKTCDTCRKLHAELKYSVSFFQNRLGDFPDMPRQLSQQHVKEIVATARELEAEQANAWTPEATEPSVPESTDSWGQILAWAAAAAVAIALGIVIVAQRPWEASPETVAEDDETPEAVTPPKPPGPAPVPETHEKPKVVDAGTEPVSPVPPDAPKPEPVKPAPEPVVKIPDNDKPGPVVKPPDEPEQKPEPEKIVTTDKPPDKTVPKPPETVDKPKPPTVVKTPDTPEPKPEPVVAAITIHSLERNRLPRYVTTSTTRAEDSDLQFTPSGHVMKISQREAAQYRQPTTGAFTDERDLFELTYKTNERSSRRLIRVNEKMLLAGGIGARDIRFKPRSRNLEVIGNRQELMAIHRVQAFLCDPEQKVLNLSYPDHGTKEDHFKKSRGGILVCFFGQPLDYRDLDAAVPTAVMTRIRQSKATLINQHKPSEDGTINGGSNDDDSHKKKPRRKMRKRKGSLSGSAKTNGKGDVVPPPTPPAPEPIPAPPAQEMPIKRPSTMFNWQKMLDDDETLSRLPLTVKHFGGVSKKTVEALKSTDITKVSFRNSPFNEIISKLCKKADIETIDLSGQGKARISVRLDNISAYDAIDTLCRQLDVRVLFTAAGVVLAPAPHPDNMQTVIFKTKFSALADRLKKAKSVTQELKDRGILFPQGAGATLTRYGYELIIYNRESNLRQAIDVLELEEWE